ncbi:CapA family protein [Nonomuraea sp. PA05]|uniref:CapA family protein n=1 Tax=Nonomuraea sp. PA05 TaxID=2604466 RepID=UPI0011D32920|nr:CapA family protein [Nonomuraea sp. PA05]TYB57399.1 CapA family protein [Nonomuraea sp. PA05]
MNDELTLYAVGDVGPERPDPDTLFTRTGPTLSGGDLAFCQLEMNLTDRGSRLPQVRHTARAAPATAGSLRRAGFDVVSWAGNHCMDWGADGFFDTIDALTGQDITVLGVGQDIAAAREPRVVERAGTKIAFLAYCSILPADYWATERRPGCAPMRAHTVYEPTEPDQPGTPCRILTYPHRDDLAALVEDVGRARERADVVIVSLHWGIHFVPAVLADYQRDVAHAAIDAGADLILGHHAHILKGVEVHRGKAIFYSLGNFAMDLPMTAEHAASKGFRELLRLHPGWEPDLGSTYNFPHDSRKTVAVRCRISRDGIGEVAILPAYIDRSSRPEFLEPDDARFAEVAAYLREVGEDQGLTTRFDPDGDALIVRTEES